MGASGAKRKVVECNAISLFFAVLAVLLALAVTFVLTYFLTRHAFEKTEKKGDEEEEKEDDGPTAAELRLPKSIRPVSYDLTLKAFLPSYVDFPHEKDFTFEAELAMKLDVLEPVQQIVLNMKNITVDKDKSHLEVNGEKVGIQSITAKDQLEKVEIAVAKTLQKGNDAKLTLVYTGLISTTLGGLYQTKYTDADGTPKVAAVTQMEPTSARQMVPCFDEPEFKASWKVRVIHPKGTNAISNGIEEKVEDQGDWITTDFVETPKMSSYLLALMVSEFEQISNSTDSGVEFRIWSRKEAKNTTQYALYAGVKCLEFYEKLFKIGFPLKKQDMVALPDFSAGAMENWGLITYRENSLLYDDRLYGPANKRRVAYVVAHELAHQWFGDLVTMKWWEDLWLNEGFATYVEFFGADWISDNKMRMKEWIILDALTSGLTRDSVSSSHPLSFKIDKATEVYEAFDSISYGKGASVLRMIAAIIGQENFDNGVAHYLDKFKYSNAQAMDLWQALDEKIADKEIQGPNGKIKIVDYADQWTTQMGFPLVTVEQVNNTHVKLTQERYRRNPKANDPKKYKDPKYGFKWEVPIWYQKGEGAVELAWLKREEPLYLPLDNADQPIVINANRNGFYRQNYDAKGWQKIAKQLKDNHTIYSSQTRNAIISDAFAAAFVDKVPYETVFDLVGYVKEETDYLPWEETINAFNSVLDFFGNEPEAKSAKNFMLKLLKPMYNTTSLERIEENYLNDDLFFENLVEQSVIDAYCALGDRDCIANYKALFDEKVVKNCKDKDAKPSECSTVAAPLRAKTYCYGVKEGGDEAYQKVMDLYMAESVQLEKDILRRALGCHKDITALKELMLLALDRNSSFVRLQDVNDIFSSVAANPVGQEIIFNFLLERWDEIYDGLMPEHRAIGRTIDTAATGIRSQQQIEQIKHLKKNGKHAKEFGTFDEAIEKAESKVEWIRKNFRKLSDFFAKSVQE